MDESAIRKRPRIVTAAGVLTYIAALIPAVSAVALFLNRDNDAWQQSYGWSSTSLLLLAIFNTTLALLLFGGGYGVMSGVSGARLLVVLAFGLNLAANAWILREVTLGMIIQGAIVLFILWVLYGSTASRDFFEG